MRKYSTDYIRWWTEIGFALLRGVFAVHQPSRHRVFATQLMAKFLQESPPGWLAWQRSPYKLSMCAQCGFNEPSTDLEVGAKQRYCVTIQRRWWLSGFQQLFSHTVPLFHWSWSASSGPLHCTVVWSIMSIPWITPLLTDWLNMPRTERRIIGKVIGQSSVQDQQLGK